MNTQIRTETRWSSGLTAPVMLEDDFLAEGSLPSMYEHLRRLGRIPHGFFLLDFDRVFRHGEGDALAAGAFAPFFGDFAALLFDYLVRLINHVGVPRESHGSLEIWTGCNGGPDELVYLHMDRHSAPMAGDREAHPTLGTAFHVGPEGWNSGGSTYLCLENPVPEALETANRRRLPMSEVLALSDTWHEVPQRCNRLVVFDGRLPHFRAPILPSVKANAPRACILANLWREKTLPLDPNSSPAVLTPSEFRSFLKLRAGDAKRVKELVHRYSQADIESIFKIVRRRFT